MAQSDGFPSNAAHKKEQYHKWHKGRIRASMKLDDNGDYDNDRNDSDGTVGDIKLHITCIFLNPQAAFLITITIT